MQRPERVMMWVAENIQACLRIFRRAQHQWLVRDILHLPQGVFTVFVLWHTGQLLHIALRCLEGSTMSNLVHRRRRCARIVPHSILLPGGQYARGRERSLSTRRRISLWLQGSLFCTANGSYFVLWLSVCQWADQTDGEGQTGKLAYMTEHTHQAVRA